VGAYFNTLLPAGALLMAKIGIIGLAAPLQRTC
jgi:hypothetical protein